MAVNFGRGYIAQSFEQWVNGKGESRGLYHAMILHIRRSNQMNILIIHLELVTTCEMLTIIIQKNIVPRDN